MKGGEFMNLGELTNELFRKQEEKKRSHFEKQIKEDLDKRLDSIHMDFVGTRDFSFDEFRLIKEVFDFIKKY